MSLRAARAILAAAVVCSGSSELRADILSVVETNPYPGIRLLKRTDSMTNPTRQVVMNIAFLDLGPTSPVRFKLTPPTDLAHLDPVCTPIPPPPAVVNWPCPSQEFEVVRQTTLQFLNDAHGQLALNIHFFAPFPVVSPPQAAYAYVIGLAASRGSVYSAFEVPAQIYAITPNSPAINIDPQNNASIVHRDPAFEDGKHVLEPVTLWNAFSGSGQIITNGLKTIPCYLPTPGCELVPPGNANYSNANSWYNLVNARSAVGITSNNKLVLFTVDVRPLPFLPSPPNPPNTPNPLRSQGMRVGEVADVLLGYDVINALNVDGGGSTTMAMQDTTDPYARRVINVPSDVPPRAEASSLAVYSDAIDPASTATASPAANAYGWNNTDVTVNLKAEDLRSGNTATLPGWVDQLQYSMEGAQTGATKVGPGPDGTASASAGVTTDGATTLTYSATDAAGNDEGEQELTVRIDRTQPDLDGMPSAECSLWPPNHEMRQVAVVTASDALSGVPAGALHVTATSSNPSNPDDVLVQPDGEGGYAVWLRAERRGNGQGRVYTINATATDRAGNERTASATCVVPHDQGTN